MRKNENFEIIIIVIGTVFMFVTLVLTQINAKHLKEYNDHVCRVYSKMPDCKTPLPESERLK